MVPINILWKFLRQDILLIYSYLLQESSPDEPSNERKLSIDMKNGTGLKDEKFDLWTPLNCLVEAANRTKSSKQVSPHTSLAESANGTKSSKMNLHGASLSKMEQPTQNQSEVQNFSEGSFAMSKAKNKAIGVTREDKNGTSSVAGSGTVKRKRLRGVGVKKAAPSEMLGLSAQLLLDASGSKQFRRNRPVWFSLVASEDQ